MSTVCGACGDIWQDGMSCGQKDNGHPFPTCYPHHAIDPDVAALREALALTSGALQCITKLLPRGEKHIVQFTGDWLHIAPMSIATILDHANAALEPKAKTGGSDAA